jgi:hypothetical protein
VFETDNHVGVFRRRRLIKSKIRGGRVAAHDIRATQLWRFTDCTPPAILSVHRSSLRRQSRALAGLHHKAARSRSRCNCTTPHHAKPVELD